MTQGPAISNSGLVVADLLARQLHDAAAAGNCAAREARAALTKPVNSGWPSRGVEVNSGWNCVATNQGWSGKLHDLHQAVGRKSGEPQARALELVQVVVVEFVAMPVSFPDHIRAIQRPRHACRRPARTSCAPRRMVPPRSDFSLRCCAPQGLVLPLGDHRDHRMRRWRGRTRCCARRPGSARCARTR